MTWEFVIPRAISSANARIVNSGKTRWAYSKSRNAWADDLRRAMQIHRIPDASGKRKITITRLMGHGQRAFDDDDFVGGAKLVRDAMQRPRKVQRMSGVLLVKGASLIMTDGASDAEFVYEQARAADGKAATLITVEDVSNGE